MTRNTQLKFENGMALVMVLVFTCALLLLGGALLGYSFNEKIIADYQAQEAALYYITEAGLEAGLAALGQDFYRQESIHGELNGGYFSVQFSKISSGKRQVLSSGSYNGFTRTLAVTAEHLKGAGYESLAADQIYLRTVRISGNLHVNDWLVVDHGQSYISGDLTHRAGAPPVVPDENALAVAGSTRPAGEIPLTKLYYELLSGRTEQAIEGGIIRQPPTGYPAQRRFLVNGDLTIAPEQELFDFAGMIVVKGDLNLLPGEEASLILDGVFAVDGDVTIRPREAINANYPGHTLLIMAGGAIELLPAEEANPQIEGRQLLYSRTSIRIQGRSPSEPVVLRGVIMAKQLRLENCTIYYDPALPQQYAADMPGLGTIRTHWVKP
ncbi:MAG: hypothetical protein AB1767_10765 [Bacillota bacterium]